MKYNYCPECGEKLPRYHLGKLCKNCRKKEFGRQAVKTAVIITVAAGIGVAGYYYVKQHKKEVAKAASKLAAQALALQAKKLSAEQLLMMEAAKRISKIKTAEE